MRYKKFQITNYKGIKKLTLDLDLKPDYKIFTLIGLNESGKTTILEAMNDFEFEVPEAERHLLIPKSAAGGFTGDITIKATLLLTEGDINKIKQFVSSKIKVKEVLVEDEFDLTRTYTFKNSKPVDTKRNYTIFVKIKKTSRSSPSFLPEEIGNETWQYLKGKLFPEIIFYRDFLSKFPDKIWLEPTDSKDREYVSIINDVLISINPSYSVTDSLLARLTDLSEANKQALEAVENELGARISKKVFDAWNRIQNVSKKEIVIKTGNDNGKYYMNLRVKEGHQTYSVSERSLGFRWFFTFLLFTEFRKERIKTSGEILFLLDEPASNLHQAAQQSLLNTFENITNKSRLVYTTHSHHLINALWLNTAYIIKNKGLVYKDDDDFDSSKTEIEAYKYKQFVASYPKEVTYFQPILDVLDYKPGMLELVPKIAITEGKFDYFIFRYFKEIIFADNNDDFNFYPGQGATNLDLPIALYESWGRNYCVILDSDKQGKSQKVRYIKEISDEYHIFTLEDVNLNNKKFSTEDFFSDEEKLNISKEFNMNLSKYNKSAFNTGIQILYKEKRVPDYISVKTKDKILEVLKFIREKLNI